MSIQNQSGDRGLLVANPKQAYNNLLRLPQCGCDEKPICADVITIPGDPIAVPVSVTFQGIGEPIVYPYGEDVKDATGQVVLPASEQGPDAASLLAFLNAIACIYETNPIIKSGAVTDGTQFTHYGQGSFLQIETDKGVAEANRVCDLECDLSAIIDFDSETGTITVTYTGESVPDNVTVTILETGIVPNPPVLLLYDGDLTDQAEDEQGVSVLDNVITLTGGGTPYIVPEVTVTVNKVPCDEVVVNYPLPVPAAAKRTTATHFDIIGDEAEGGAAKTTCGEDGRYFTEAEIIGLAIKRGTTFNGLPIDPNTAYIAHYSVGANVGKGKGKVSGEQKTFLANTGGVILYDNSDTGTHIKTKGVRANKLPRVEGTPLSLWVANCAMAPIYITICQN